MEHKSAGWDIIIGNVPTFDRAAADKAQALEPFCMYRSYKKGKM